MLFLFNKRIRVVEREKMAIKRIYSIASEWVSYTVKIIWPTAIFFFSSTILSNPNQLYIRTRHSLLYMISTTYIAK